MMALTACLISTLFSNRPAYASRTLRISPYPVRYIYTYDPACSGRGGSLLSYQLMLTNLANTPQTITISILPGSTASILSPSCGAWSIVKYGHCLYGGAGASQASAVTSLSPVNFTLPPNANVTYIMGGTGEATISPSGCGGGKQPLGDFAMNVSFQISVAEDRGAIQGSMVPQIDGPVPGIQFCGIPLNGPYVCLAVLQNLRTSVPILLNGGRPF